MIPQNTYVIATVIITLAWAVAAPALALQLYEPAHDYADAEIAGPNWLELELLATEPYARQGFVSDSDWLMDHYLATDWYGPIHGSSAHIAAAMKFTAKEEADMARFEEAAAKLEPTCAGCWWENERVRNTVLLEGRNRARHPAGAFDLTRLLC